MSRTSSCFLALLFLVGTACGTTAPTGTILYEDPHKTVSLQTIPDHSIHATHPINLKPALLAQVLKGIQVQDHGDRLLQRLLAGPSSPVPAFSDEQIQFLAPLLAEGLRTASQDQQVEYCVQTLYEGSALEFSYTETTAGSLYASGQQLFVTLSQYRYSKARTNINVRNINYQSVGLDYNGLKNRILVFTPKAAQRSDSFDPPPGGKSTDRFLAIDYQLLQHASPSAATTEQTAPQTERATPIRESLAGTSASEVPSHTTETLAQRDAEIHTLKDLVIKKDLELETLRKELQSVRKQLDSQKRKPTPPSKPQQTAP